MAKDNKLRINLMLSKDANNKLTKIAKDSVRSRSEMVEYLIKTYTLE